MTSKRCHRILRAWIGIGIFEQLNNPLLSIRMESNTLEFFKLDEIDRKVLVWLLAHVPEKSVSAWLDYIGEAYRREKSVQLDISRLSEEINEHEFEKS
ncbi:MAG TPA: hypothetical protein VGK59_13985 [Ohtaekwangia sp.]